MEIGIHAVKPGSIILVERTFYDHYAVYAGQGEVIHYAPKNSGSAVIHRAGLSEFLDGANRFFVPHVPQTAIDMEMLMKYEWKQQIFPQKLINDLVGVYQMTKFVVCTAKETLQRALSRIGESAYNLISNNCEDFAFWCKFKVQMSTQINRIYEIFKTFILKQISQRYIRYVKY